MKQIDLAALGLKLLREYQEKAATQKEFLFRPREDGQLVPFYGTFDVTDAGNCSVMLTRDGEKEWLRVGEEIFMDFGELQDYDVIPVD